MWRARTCINDQTWEICCSPLYRLYSACVYQSTHSLTTSILIIQSQYTHSSFLLLWFLSSWKFCVFPWHWWHKKVYPSVSWTTAIIIVCYASLSWQQRDGWGGSVCLSVCSKFWREESPSVLLWMHVLVIIIFFNADQKSSYDMILKKSGSRSTSPNNLIFTLIVCMGCPGDEHDLSSNNTPHQVS